jgi:hypothetical protein
MSSRSAIQMGSRRQRVAYFGSMSRDCRSVRRRSAPAHATRQANALCAEIGVLSLARVCDLGVRARI